MGRSGESALWRIHEVGGGQSREMTDFLYGRNAILEALKANRREFFQVFMARGVQEKGAIARIAETCRRRGIRVHRVPRRQLDEMIGSGHHQGVVASASSYPYAEISDILGRTESRTELPLLVLLDHLQDPQNLGTLLRTAEAVGVHGIVVPRRRSAQITPAVSKASAGAVEHLSIVSVSNLSQQMQALKGSDVWIAGLEDVPEAQHYRESDLNRPLALVIGSESRGLSRLTRERCDFLVRLPMSGSISSLNAAVAGSIVLYEIWEQRQGQP